MTRRRLAATAFAASLLLAACGGGGGDDDGGDGELRTVSDPATPVEASIGDVVEISLEANPTTGFSWELSGPPESAIVRFLGGDYESRGEAAEVDEDADGDAPAPVLGGGGVQRLRFQVVGAGATTVQLRYVQPWVDPPEPAATSSFTIRVSNAAPADDDEG
ncbi:MAG: protease inhibitor I42 family protein [Actinomycetota bacterium]